MASFFTETFSLKTLADAWSVRKRELRTLNRTAARDELLVRLKNHCIANRSTIHLELVDAALNAHSRSQLRVPIWSYRAVSFKGWVEDHGTRLHDAQRMGQDDTMQVNGWTERIHTIVRQTDFETLLAAFFGPAFRVRAVKEPVVEARGYDWESHTWTLLLEYYPELPTVTPPPASPVSEPPPLRRRAGSIRDYDSVEEAARDLMAECYCQQR